MVLKVSCLAPPKKNIKHFFTYIFVIHNGYDLWIIIMNKSPLKYCFPCKYTCITFFFYLAVDSK